MLHDTDPEYVKRRSFRIPLYFYKIVVFGYNGALYATGFVMSQKERLSLLGLIDAPVEEVFEKAVIAPSFPFSDYKRKEVFQVNISLIEDYTGLTFSWQGVSRVEVPEGQHKLRRIARQQEGDSAVGFEKAAFRAGGRSTNIILPNQ